MPLLAGLAHLLLVGVSRRGRGVLLAPAVRLFRLAEKNLTPFTPTHHGFDVAGLVRLLKENMRAIVDSGLTRNPWLPETAPQLSLGKVGRLLNEAT